jgi:geranylgeranyl diphosphate synthase type II
MFGELKDLVERTLDEVLPKADVRPSVLSEAMRYAVGSGGKRVRPLICLASAIAAGGKGEDAKFPAAAIEILHNYTLVHDDLPAMDNDVERRGNPTVWKKYGEANAILVGDALQALACAVVAKTPVNAGKILSELGVAGIGVVQGQVEDIAATKDVEFIYTHKTADLFIAAAVMGGLAADASDADIERLRSFALNLGLAFQYEDDLLDSDSPYGRKETEQLAADCTSAAIAALEGLPGDTSFLRKLASQLLGREA